MSRSKTVREIKVSGGEEGLVLEVRLYYSKGGMNFFNYANEKRGYSLSVTPVVNKTDRGFTTQQFMLGTGIKSLVLEAKRYSAKVLGELEVNEELLAKLVAHVVEKQNLKLEQAVA